MASGGSLPRWGRVNDNVLLKNYFQLSIRHDLTIKLFKNTLGYHTHTILLLGVKWAKPEFRFSNVVLAKYYLLVFLVNKSWHIHIFIYIKEIHFKNMKTHFFSFSILWHNKKILQTNYASKSAVIQTFILVVRNKFKFERCLWFGLVNENVLSSH